MSIRAVIFDRDGVLTNFDELKAKAYFETILPVTVKELTQYWLEFSNKNTPPTTDEDEKIFFEKFWKKLSSDFKLPASIQEKLHQVSYIDFMYAYPESKNILEEIRQLNIKVGVLSNFTLASLHDSLACLNLLNLIDSAHTAVKIGIAKPHPDAYLCVTKELQVNPEECLFFDDDQANIDGALALGMSAYLLKRNSPKHDLSQRIICDLTAVTEILKSHLQKK